MSVKSLHSRGSTMVEVPGVTPAVEHLQELGLRMRSVDFGFNENDVDSVDKIIDSINELHTESSKLHEKLETETIHASVLRHKLRFYPQEIRNELEAATKSARQSNADEIYRLRTQLETINEHIKELEQSHTELEKENAVLHPERDRVRQEHEEIIAQLNQKMAEKASKQIYLNETRDKLRETNQRIIDLEEGIIQLREDLIQERAETRIEKKRLKKAVYDTTIKTREQRDVNQVKKKELDELQEQVNGSEDKVDTVQQSIDKYETSRAKLSKRNDHLSTKLDRELNENQQLKVRGQELDKELADQEEAFACRRAELERKIQQLDDETAKEKKNNATLMEMKEELDKKVKVKSQQKSVTSQALTQMNEELQAAKMELAEKAEESAKVTQENMELDEKILELQETHDYGASLVNERYITSPPDSLDGSKIPLVAIMGTMIKQIQDLKERLAKERKERYDPFGKNQKDEVALQKERDELTHGIDEMKYQTSTLLVSFDNRIVEGKKSHDRLVTKGKELQQEIKHFDEAITEKTVMIDKLQEDFAKEKTKLENKIAELEKEITVLAEEEKAKAESFAEKNPPFLELEEKFREAEIEYDTNKKALIALKNKKLGLEDNCKQAREAITKTVAPREALKGKIKQCRADAIMHLKANAAKVKKMEETIFDMSCKLKAIIEENYKFEDSNNKIEAELDHVHKHIANSNCVMQALLAEVARMKDALNKGWDDDNMMTDIFIKKDHQLVVEMDELLDRTTKREETIQYITEQLDKEILVLGDFLENVAKRRPKESGETPGISRPTTAASHATPLPPGVRPPTTRPPTEKSSRNDVQTPAAKPGSPTEPPTTPTQVTVSLGREKMQNSVRIADKSNK